MTVAAIRVARRLAAALEGKRFGGNPAPVARIWAALKKEMDG